MLLQTCLKDDDAFEKIKFLFLRIYLIELVGFVVLIL